MKRTISLEKCKNYESDIEFRENAYKCLAFCGKYSIGVYVQIRLQMFQFLSTLPNFVKESQSTDHKKQSVIHHLDHKILSYPTPNKIVRLSLF